MGQYSKPALELLCDQIRRDNPNLDIELDSSTLMLLSGPLTTNLGSSGRNTRIRVNGVMGNGSSGKRELFYDRVHLPTYTAKLPQGLVVTFANKAHTVADALPDINDAFGLMLTPEDIRDGTTVLPFGNTPTQITVNLAAECLNFTGLLTFKWRRGAAGYYPNSGPGSKQMLFGDMTEGYFGVVPVSELVGPGAFYNQMLESGNRGSSLPLPNPNLFWLKFALDDRIVYIASQNMVTNIGWDTIYAAGGIDASGAEAKYPPVGKEPTEQLAIVSVHADGRDHYLRPRLTRLSAVDPCPSAKGDATSDMVRLFNKVHAGANGTGVWDTLPVGGAGLDITNQHWYQNSVEGGTASAHAGSLSAGVLATGLKNVLKPWRPVLVLMSKDELLLPVKNQQFDILNVPPAIVIENVILPAEGDHLKPVTSLSILLDGFAQNIPFTVDEGVHVVSVEKVSIGLIDSPPPISFIAERT